MRRSAAFFPIAFAVMILASGAQAQDAREGPIEIDKCQTIDQPGSYKLVNNLTFKGPADTACLTIATSFVSIDLAGFTIGGFGPAAFPVPGFVGSGIVAEDNTRNITVRNGSISGGFVAGVRLTGSNSIVEGLSVSGGGGVGIFATGIVRGNALFGVLGPPGNGIGISATGVITGNLVFGSRAGIVAGQGSTVIGNTATNPVDVGIYVNCPSNVTDNTAIGNPASNLVLNGTGCNNTNNVAP